MDCSLRFLFEDFLICARDNNVNYGAWHVYEPLFCSTVPAGSLVPKFYFQLTKKCQREVLEKVEHNTISQMA